MPHQFTRLNKVSEGLTRRAPRPLPTDISYRALRHRSSRLSTEAGAECLLSCAGPTMERRNKQVLSGSDSCLIGLPRRSFGSNFVLSIRLFRKPKPNLQVSQAASSLLSHAFRTAWHIHACVGDGHALPPSLLPRLDFVEGVVGNERRWNERGLRGFGQARRVFRFSLLSGLGKAVLDLSLYPCIADQAPGAPRVGFFHVL